MIPDLGQLSINTIYENNDWFQQHVTRERSSIGDDISKCVNAIFYDTETAEALYADMTPGASNTETDLYIGNTLREGTNASHLGWISGAYSITHPGSESNILTLDVFVELRNYPTKRSALLMNDKESHTQHVEGVEVDIQHAKEVAEELSVRIATSASSSPISNYEDSGYNVSQLLYNRELVLFVMHYMDETFKTANRKRLILIHGGVYASQIKQGEAINEVMTELDMGDFPIWQWVAPKLRHRRNPYDLGGPDEIRTICIVCALLFAIKDQVIQLLWEIMVTPPPYKDTADHGGLEYIEKLQAFRLLPGKRVRNNCSIECAESRGHRVVPYGPK